MGGCFSTEDQYVPQNDRLATDPAIRRSGNDPHRNELPRPKPDPKPNLSKRPETKPRPSPKKNPQRPRSTESLPSDLLRALEDIWAEEEEEEARHPKTPGNGTGRPPIVPERPFSAPPSQGLGRHLSVLSAPPQAEFPTMPELSCPVLPPDGVFFDGYVPPVPKKIPLDHPPPASFGEEHLSHLEIPIEPPQNPPKESKGIPTPPQKPDGIPEELSLTKAADDQLPQVANDKLPQVANDKLPQVANDKLPQVANDKHPLAAELPSQRPTAELPGQLPPTELDSTLMANPVEEELRIKYRDAVPFAPNFTELPAQMPPARSASMYAPHLVGCEWDQDKAVPVMQARVASPIDEDEVYYEISAAGAAYGGEG